MMSAVSGNPGTPPPAATRASAPGWRDPRLWIGVAIVAVSVIVGARLLGSADRTESVWAVTGDLSVGDRVTAEDLVSRRVHFADGGDLDLYFTTRQALPRDARLLRPVGSGELLPRSALGAAGGSDSLLLPLAVPPASVPPGVGPGSVVDVYVVAGRGCRACDSPVLNEVTVVDAAAPDQLADSRQLVVSVEPDEASAWFSAVAAVDDPAITVVGHG